MCNKYFTAVKEHGKYSLLLQTKPFKLCGMEFGWQAIKDLWQWECARREKGNAPMVPNLRESHVLRDSWTKLNTAPAKIMQVFIQHIIIVIILLCTLNYSRRRYYLNYTTTLTSNPHQVIKHMYRPHLATLKHVVNCLRKGF